MDAEIKLENRKIKPKNGVFFDDVTDILREEGYSRFWLRFRRNMHEVFDENDSLKSKVEEMQKAFETIHGIASETFESPNQLELIRLTAAENLKGVTNEPT